MEYSWWYSRRPGRRWPPGRDDSSGAGCSRSTHLRRSETSARGRDDRNPRSVAQPARTLRPGSVNERRHRHEQETEHRVSASSLDHARRPDRKGPAERCPGRAQLSAHGGWMLLGVAAGAGISDLGSRREPGASRRGPGRRGAPSANRRREDPAVDWSTFDVVAVVYAWGYVTRREAFLEWVDAAAAATVVNDPTILRWNRCPPAPRRRAHGDGPALPEQRRRLRGDRPCLHRGPFQPRRRQSWPARR